jgi:peptidyl-prolyl cis-trans isomerase B (cyclophilin B)
MARWLSAWDWGLRPAVVAICIGAVGLAGCGKKPAGEAAEAAASAPTDASTTGTSGEKAQGAAETVWPDDRLHQHFAQAARQGEDPPEGCERPADETVTGKSVGKLYSEVQRLWDTIEFTTAAGKRIEYTAILETDLGPIEIALNAEAAPNHCRNFIALARAGYYDGLSFDRILHQQSADNPADKLDRVEAGCPLGPERPGLDHLGYWLRAELDDAKNPKLPHDEGTVGSLSGGEEDSDGVCFYITLNKAPFLDGNFSAFGKVVHGLDVVHKIHGQPVIVEDEDPDDSHRPEKPVVIRKVTIQTREAEETR